MKQTKTARVVRENVALEFVDQQGEASAIDADLVFDPADPYAVTMVFRTGVQEVLWTFGRELLADLPASTGTPGPDIFAPSPRQRR